MTGVVSTFVAAGFASLGLLALILFVYRTIRLQELRTSIRDTVEGDPLFNANQIVKILSQFQSDDARLKALENLTKHDSAKARVLLDQFGKGPGLDKLSDFATKEPSRKIVGGSAAFLIVISIIGVVVGQLLPWHDISEDINAMYSNLNAKRYDDALKKADDVLRVEPRNFRALNVKGTVAFYRRQFQDAVKYFDQALAAAPEDKIIAGNLADAYVEVGAYELAIETYRKAKSATETWHYSIGRAFLFADKYSDALPHLQFVKSDDNQRAGRVLMAATLAGMSLKEENEQKRAELIARAREELKVACARDSAYWTDILVGGKKVEHETYEKIIPLLERIYVDGKPCSRAA